MTDKSRRWGRILSGVPNTDPPAENVVPLRRQTLDEMERDLVDAQNSVIDKGAGVDRAVLAYRSARDHLNVVRDRFAERLKESGIRAEYTHEFPDIEDEQHGTSD